MHSPHFTAEPSSTGTVERDSTLGDLPGLPSPASGTERPPLMFDVIVAGCGPTGAMLAAELRLHDVRVLVLERETEPASFVRIVGLHIRTIELMAMRGLLERILERGRQRPAGGFFAAIDKPAPEGLDSAYAYLLGIPQPVIVHLLEEHAIDLGAQVRRGCAVVDLVQDDEGVTVELADGERLRSRCLVGCDGGRSTVRKLLGVGFPGEPSRNETLMGEMEVGVPQEEIATKAAEVGETDRRFSLRSFGKGVYRVVVPVAPGSATISRTWTTTPPAGSAGPPAVRVSTGAPASAEPPDELPVEGGEPDRRALHLQHPPQEEAFVNACREGSFHYPLIVADRI